MRLYLEVDGVINAVYGPRSWVGHTADGRSKDVFDSTTFDRYTFVWSRELVHRLVEWAEKDGNEIVWASYWNYQMDILSRVLGFGRTGADARYVMVSGEGGKITPYSKMRAILEDVKENPVEGGDWVALDPDLSKMIDEEGLEWLAELALAGGDIPPIEAEVGITPGLMSHLDTYDDIDSWIEQMTLDAFDEDGGWDWDGNFNSDKKEV